LRRGGRKKKIGELRKRAEAEPAIRRSCNRRGREPTSLCYRKKGDSEIVGENLQGGKAKANERSTVEKKSFKNTWRIAENGKPIGHGLRGQPGAGEVPKESVQRDRGVVYVVPNPSRDDSKKSQKRGMRSPTWPNSTHGQLSVLGDTVPFYPEGVREVLEGGRPP